MRRPILIALISVLFLAVCLAQESFLAGLGRPFDLIDIPIFASLFAISLFHERIAFFLVFATLTIRGLIATDFAVSLAVLGVLLFISLTQMQARFLTNRTYYSVLALSGIGWGIAVVGRLFIPALSQLALHGTLANTQIPAWPSFAVSFGTLMLFLTAAYALTVSLNKRVRSYFIVSPR